MEEKLERNGEARIMEPRDVVQAAIDAYHAHDLDRCLSFYAPDVDVKGADGTILMDGANAVRGRDTQSRCQTIRTFITTSLFASRSAPMSSMRNA